jgi:prolyl-tRNA synthetase
MSSQNDESAAQTLPDRTQQNPAEDKGEEVSKNAAKKAAKAAKLAEQKADKAKNKEKGIGKSEAKQPTAKSKKKIEGAALIGIDVSKEDDFPTWYQQVLTKGEMLDYYDVSGCFILKVYSSISGFFFYLY